MFTINLLDEVIKQVEEDRNKPFIPIYIHTGFYGSLAIDFLMSDLYFNITYHKKGKYRTTINLLKKDGIYKIHITKNHTFVFCEGT